MKKIILLALVCLLALTGCAPRHESKVIPVTVTFQILGDVAGAVHPEDLIIPQSTTYSTVLHLDGKITSPEVFAFGEKTVTPGGVELLTVYWSGGDIPLTDSQCPFYPPEGQFVSSYGYPIQDSKICYDTINSISLMMTARLMYCPFSDYQELRCQAGNLSLKYDHKTLSFTISEVATAFYREIIEDFLVYEGIDPSILPNVIMANANYQIALP